MNVRRMLALCAAAAYTGLLTHPTRAADFDDMRNRAYHGSLLRDGVFKASGVPRWHRVRWSFKTQAEVKSSPVVADGMLYVGSWDGHLYALAADTGALAWKHKTNGRVTAPPCVAHGSVVVASEDGSLHALDPRTGAVRWQALHYTRFRPVGAVLPVGGLLLAQEGGTRGSDGISMTLGRVCAFDPTAGTLRWHAELGCQGYDAMASEGTLVVVNSSDLIAGAFDVATGKIAWTYTVPYYSRGYGGVAIGGDRVFVVGTGAGVVSCLELRTGKRLWERAILPGQVTRSNGGLPGYEILTTPAVSAERVIFGCNDGQLYALSVADGSTLWSFRTGGSIHSSPSVAAGVVYFGGFDKKLYALDETEGRLLWTFATGGRIVSSPWVADGVVYVGSDDGCVYALE